MDLILASSSPRRKKILASLGAAFTVVSPEADEIKDSSDPIRTVVVNARAKAEACRARYPGSAIIAADTLVWFENRLVGKPQTLEQGAEFLRAFSGRTQIVYTGVALGRPCGHELDIRVEASSVTFRKLSEAIIQDYLRRTRPLDRAGAYDIDENGDLLIASIQGSYTNVMGLPAAPVRDWLVALGLLSA